MYFAYKIGQIKDELNRQIDRDMEILKRCPKGKLYRNKNGKGYSFYHVTESNGRRRRKTIAGDERLQDGLLLRSMLEDELKKLECCRDIMSNTVARISGIEKDLRQDFLMKRFPWMDMARIQRLCASDSAGDAWMSQPYERSNYRAEDLTQMTSFGLLVRSKSELLIAEMLHRYGIAFRYEQVLHLPDGQIIVPDFTIRRADGKIFIWEHEGYVSSEKYIRRQRWKAEQFAQEGFLPWDNLVITYDTDGGNIDLRIVEAEIRNKLLVYR